MEQWEPIKYVSSNKNVQELLKMLYDHGSASYDQIKHLANSHVIQQLDSFGLIEYGIAHSLKARMDTLQETIDSTNQNATTLLENNEKSLRLILRDQLKSVNEHVSENVDAFIANMNRSNPSHLQFNNFRTTWNY